MTGILLGYLASYLFIDDIGGWRLMYGLAAGPALIVLAGMVSFSAHIYVHKRASFTQGRESC